MFRVEIVLISDKFQIVFTEDAGNTLVSPQKKKHTLTKLVQIVQKQCVTSVIFLESPVNVTRHLRWTT